MVGSIFWEGSFRIFSPTRPVSGAELLEVWIHSIGLRKHGRMDFLLAIFFKGEVAMSTNMVRQKKHIENINLTHDFLI